jgi:hypothetical protein
MSRRTIRDYIHQAFLSRDKASVAAVADEAEQAFAQPNEEKDGGDDGDDKDHSGHQGGVHVHIEHGGKEPSTDAKAADARFAKIEDSIAKLTKTISRVADAVGVKDGEMPEELRQARAGQGEGGEAPDESDGDGDGDGDGDDGEKKNPFAAKDEDPESGTQGAMEAEILKEAEPEMMNADPALHTGKSGMGDKDYRKRVADAFALVVRDAAARAEVLSPGSRMPTIDAATLDAQAATKRLCAFRRSTLLGAVKTDNGRKAIGSHTTDGIKRMSCDAVRMLFDDASTKMWKLNNDSAREITADAFRPQYSDLRNHRQKQAEALAAINARNSEFWSKQSGRPN